MKAKELAELLMQHPEKEIVVECYDYLGKLVHKELEEEDLHETDDFVYLMV